MTSASELPQLFVRRRFKIMLERFATNRGSVENDKNATRNSDGLMR